MLHGHAVGTGMGFGAFISGKLGWITESDMERVLKLITDFELSLWHDVLSDKQAVWLSQEKMTEKRGGNLAAPLPKGSIGSCGFLNEMSKKDLDSFLDGYRDYCSSLKDHGIGNEPLCEDVGLEHPVTVLNKTSAF